MFEEILQEVRSGMTMTDYAYSAIANASEKEISDEVGEYACGVIMSAWYEETNWRYKNRKSNKEIP